MPADRLRRQNDVVALRLEAFEAAILAQQRGPGRTRLAQPNRYGSLRPGGNRRRQCRFDRDAGQTVDQFRHGSRPVAASPPTMLVSCRRRPCGSRRPHPTRLAGFPRGRPDGQDRRRSCSPTRFLRSRHDCRRFVPGLLLWPKRIARTQVSNDRLGLGCEEPPPGIPSPIVARSSGPLAPPRSPILAASHIRDEIAGGTISTGTGWAWKISTALTSSANKSAISVRPWSRFQSIPCPSAASQVTSAISAPSTGRPCNDCPLNRRRQCPAQSDHRSGEFDQPAVRSGPIYPGPGIILRVSVVVAVLRPAKLVAHRQHRCAARQEQGRQQSAHIPRPGRNDRRIGRRTLGAVVPGQIVVRSVSVVLAVRVVLLRRVRHEIAKGKAIMGGDVVDAARDRPLDETRRPSRRNVW